MCVSEEMRACFQLVTCRAVKQPHKQNHTESVARMLLCHGESDGSLLVGFQCVYW